MHQAKKSDALHDICFYIVFQLLLQMEIASLVFPPTWNHSLQNITMHLLCPEPITVNTKLLPTDSTESFLRWVWVFFLFYCVILCCCYCQSPPTRKDVRAGKKNLCLNSLQPDPRFALQNVSVWGAKYIFKISWVSSQRYIRSAICTTSEVLYLSVDIWVSADTGPVYTNTKVSFILLNRDFECGVNQKNQTLNVASLLCWFWRQSPLVCPHTLFWKNCIWSQNLETNTNIFFFFFFNKCTWKWSGEEPAANIEPCVCVFRARNMTEQQEQSEETGVLSTQDLDPSKDDDTHGHFRQISHTHNYHTALHRLLSLPYTPSVSCARSWVTARGDLFSQHVFCAFVSAGFDVNNGQICTQMHTKWLWTEIFLFTYRPGDKKKKIYRSF